MTRKFDFILRMTIQKSRRSTNSRLFIYVSRSKKMNRFFFIMFIINKNSSFEIRSMKIKIVCFFQFSSNFLTSWRKFESFMWVTIVCLLISCLKAASRIKSLILTIAIAMTKRFFHDKILILFVEKSKTYVETKSNDIEKIEIVDEIKSSLKCFNQCWYSFTFWRIFCLMKFIIVSKNFFNASK